MRVTSLQKIALFTFGVLISLAYGRLGLMPLDQSIIFDGGWRILSGQTPFKEFTTPAGIVPIYLQALFFKIFSVNWFAYCVHAAVFNGLFAVLVYELLLLFQTNRYISLLSATLSAVTFYPPFGVPYMEQHSFFFGLLALYLTMKGCDSNSRREETFFWILVPIACILGALSKQIPIVFIVPSILLLPALLRLARFPNFIFSGLVGSVLGLSAVALFFKNDVKLYLLREYLWNFPAYAGQQRFSNIHSILDFGNLLAPILKQHCLRTTLLLTTILLLTSLFLCFRKKDLIKNLAQIFLCLNLLFTSFLFAVIAWQHYYNASAYIILAASLAVNLFAHSTHKIPALKIPSFILIALFLSVMVFETILFNRLVNKERLVHFDDSPPNGSYIDGSYIDKRLSFLEFDLPSYINKNGKTAEAKSLKDLIVYLKRRNLNFLLIGDISFIYGITGKPSILPALWLHPDLTFPNIVNPHFEKFERKIIRRIRKHKVALVIEETPHSWMSINLSFFPELTKLVYQNLKSEKHFGRYKVYEIELH